jgi:hypothetical protein
MIVRMTVASICILPLCVHEREEGVLQKSKAYNVVVGILSCCRAPPRPAASLAPSSFPL